MFYYNQNDYDNEQYNKPDGTKTTIAIGGCGVVAACIAINNACGKELYSVKKMRDLSQSSGARISDGTDIDKLLKAVCKAHPEFSFKATQLNNELLSHLKKGNMAIINQGDAYNVFSTSGHFVTAVALFDKDVVDVYDPQLYSGKYEQYSRPQRIEMATKYGARVKIDEISKASKDRNPCYWLINYDKPKENLPDYKIDKAYTITDVRGVYADKNAKTRKKVKELTADGKKHATSKKSANNAYFKKGTKVTVLEAFKDAKKKKVMVRCPSGWITAYNNNTNWMR